MTQYRHRSASSTTSDDRLPRFAARAAMRPAMNASAGPALQPPLRLAALLGIALAAIGLALPGAVYAAMNFCAAPASQNSDRGNANPGVRTLLANVDAHINDQPHPHASLRPIAAAGATPPGSSASSAAPASAASSKPTAASPSGGSAPGHSAAAVSTADAADTADATDASRQFALMRDAALAWRVGSQPRYLQLVDRYLAAWVATYQPDFNPLEESRFGDLILAYDVTASALPVKTRNDTALFLRRLANGYLAQIAQQKTPLAGDFRNHWQSRRVKLIAMAALTLDDRKMINAAQKLFVDQIANNVDADGKTIDFTEHDALRSVTDDLEPLAMAALAARRHNRNWLRQRAPNGATLERALDWLAPYAFGRQSRDAAVRPGESGRPDAVSAWDPRDAAQLYYLAARLDRRYLPVATRLAAGPPTWLVVCLPLPT